MLIAGKFYAYPVERYVYADLHQSKQIDKIEYDEPFILLERDYLEYWKVLTINGVVGWIHIGYTECVKLVA